MKKPQILAAVFMTAVLFLNVYAADIPPVQTSSITGGDEVLKADVTTVSGKNRLATDPSLATNAATESTLSAFSAKFSVLGQNTMANSQPVVIASNQSAIPVNQSGTFTTGRTWTLSSSTDSVSIAPSIISASNSTTTPLGSSATFTGTFVDTLGYHGVSFLIKSDQPSAANGVKIEWSADGITTHADDLFSHAGTHGDQWSFGLMARYVRIRYVNGTSAQGSLVIQTILHTLPFKPSSHRVDDEINSDDDAELVKAVITAQDSNGTYHNISSDDEGRLIVTTPNFANDSNNFVFGNTTQTNPGNFPVRKTTYTEQTTNAQRSIKSASTSDTNSAGTGARVVLLTYLDQTGAGPFTESINLNGTTCVSTTNTNIAFIESIVVTSVGSGGSNAGILSLFSNNSCGATTVARITAGDNRTMWAQHYCPLGKTCKVTGISFGNDASSSGNGAGFRMYAKTLNSSTAPEIQISDDLRIAGISSTTTRNFDSPIIVIGPTRLLMYTQPEGTSTIVEKASFDFFEE